MYYFLFFLMFRLCNGTCYWSKPRRQSVCTCSSSSTSTNVRTTSSKFNTSSSHSKIACLQTRLEKIGANSEEDSCEYNEDSSEDIELRDQQSMRKMKTFVQSRALSKKFKKKFSKVLKKKVIPLVTNKIINTAMSRSINDNSQRPFQESSSTMIRTSTNTLGTIGNVYLSLPKGYVANTVSATTTRILTEQEAFNLGLFNSMSVRGSEMYSSYQDDRVQNVAGSTASRSLYDNNMIHEVGNKENLNEYYVNNNLQNSAKSYSLNNINTDSQQYKKFTSIGNNIYDNKYGYNSYYQTDQKDTNTLNLDKINSLRKFSQYKSLTNNNLNNQNNQNTINRPYKLKNINTLQRFDGLKTTNDDLIVDNRRNNVKNSVDIDQYNQKSDAALNYRNIKTSQGLNQYTSYNDKNINTNCFDKKSDNQINQVNQNTKSTQINKIDTKFGTTLKTNKFKNDKSIESYSSVDTNNSDDYKSKFLTGVYGRTINIGNKYKNIENDESKVTESSNNVVNCINDNKDHSKTEINSIHKDAVNVAHKRSMYVNDETVKKDYENDLTKDNDNYYSDEYDDSEDEEQFKDKISVYEHSNTYRKFRFDCGLYGVGIIKEVLNQLDIQRLRIMDDIVYPQDCTHSIINNTIYDFIIVGGGNGGCVLANLLSQNFNLKILLIEAGGDPFPVTQVPGLWDRVLNSKADWQHEVEPDITTGYGINGKMIIHKGKSLGGSSITGPQLYIRGSKKLYNSLVEKGLKNWSYRETEIYFKKIEKIRSTTKTEINITNIYGNSGLVPVSKFRKTEVTVLENIICSGFEHIGYKKEHDINHKDIEVGFVSMQGIIQNGRTCNTAKAYLSSIFERDNLTVMKHARVLKVLIDKMTMKAIGVKVQTRFGQIITLKAQKEILLCAGAIGSAQILMASGIGPEKHLTDMKVPIVKNLPVGDKFIVTPVFTGFVLSYNTSITGVQTDEEIAFKYLARHSGPLSIPKGMGFGGFINTGISEFADIEVHQFYVPKNSPSMLCQLKSMFGFSDNVLSMYAKLNVERHISIFSLALINTKSTGKIFLRNEDPLAKPIIIGNLLTNQDDVNCLLKGIKILSKIVNADAMKLVDARLEGIDLDGCAKYSKHTEDHWKCLLKYLVSTTSSTAGSCRMGLETDPEAVVNSELNVIDISNLRVVGRASAPMIISAYSHVPCIMIAEKVYDMIRSKYNLRT